jgi:gluconolactonase
VRICSVGPGATAGPGATLFCELIASSGEPTTIRFALLWKLSCANMWLGTRSVRAVVVFILPLALFQGAAATTSGSSVDDQYVPGPDSAPHTEVPHGEVFQFTLEHSRIYPGTTREVSVYVPAQYTADKPACLYIGLDGLLFDAPVVFDNLIFKKEMPVTIGIGVPAGSTRLNRSVEFDSIGDKLAQFLVDEVLPEVERRKTTRGLTIRLSRDPNDRAVGGLSSGGTGAFTLGWSRPDQFRRLFIAVGSFAGERDSYKYAMLVRKTEPKTLRIFMQDGSNDELSDLEGEIGDLWMGNQTLEQALVFSGYEVAHVWGEGRHSDRHATAIFPDAMRWLWQEWPRPVIAGRSGNVFLKQILRPGEGWRPVKGSYKSAGALAANSKGEIALTDEMSGKTKIISGDLQIRDYAPRQTPYSEIAFGPEGRVYAAESVGIVEYNRTGSSTLARGIHGAALLLAHNGMLYVTEPSSSGATSNGRLWGIGRTGKKILLDDELAQPSGLALSPDGQWLTVSDRATQRGYNYRVRADGTLQDREEFYQYQAPDDGNEGGPGLLSTDRDGRLYVASRIGVQVFDRSGRLRAILPVPGGAVSGISFGDMSLETLYVSCSDGRVYRRALQTSGVLSWEAPVQLTASE